MDTTTTGNTRPAPVARIVGGPARTRTVALTWPVEFDGKLYETITVKRLTTQEVAAFLEAARSAGGDAEVRYPMFDCPDPVLDALDDDDTLKINEAVADFLPLRFRATPEPASTPETGDATAPTSAS